jgi:hypothetical protein
MTEERDEAASVHELPDWEAICKRHDYPLANVLPHGNKSIRRVNYSTVFAVFVAAFYAISLIFFH